MRTIAKRIRQLEATVGMQTISPMTIEVVFADSSGAVEPGFSFEIGSNGMRKEFEI